MGKTAEMVETQEWLSRAVGLDMEIKALRNMLEASRARIEAISPGRHSEALARLEAFTKARIAELEAVQLEVAQAIDTVEDESLRRLLILRYLHGLTWGQIGEVLGYSAHYVMKGLHKKALAALVNGTWCAGL